MSAPTIVYNHFPYLAGAMDRRAEKLARDAAEAVRDKAEQNTTRVQTGAMRGGWRVATLGFGLYAVYNTQWYAVFHEYGTTGIGAAPMLDPAIADVKSQFGMLAAGFWRVT